MKITTTLVLSVCFILSIPFQSSAQISIATGPSFIRFIGNDAFTVYGGQAQVDYRFGDKNIAVLLRAGYYKHDILPDESLFPVEGEFINIETVTGLKTFLIESKGEHIHSHMYFEGNAGFNNYTTTTSRIYTAVTLPPETVKKSVFRIGSRVGYRIGLPFLGLEVFGGTYLPFTPNRSDKIVLEGGISLAATF